MNYHNVSFVTSVTDRKGFIRDGRPQIVFSGKSNVGKSSVINCLLKRKNFARVGGTPGKTVHINYFSVDSAAYFVDLPGYGYAAVSKAERDRWGRLLEAYFSEEGLISGGVMIVDCRHRPTADDVTMAGWFRSAGCPVIVAANKCDKVKRSELEGNLTLIRDTLGLGDGVPVLPFSAEKGTGRDELAAWIDALAPGAER
ncbi:MAG: ribosome biogenesis GTP-binding protein YihA/YsxC [Oscillospiraceae bacterium]|jgi:GTP-binding protein|nr:ribosome biogenesis GTP-binding protein YihA/YsxC [Oscillospiraceae bacterium]